MSIAKQVIRQRDWSAGEIDPDGERRDDTEVFKYGERKSLNMQSLRTGAIENRYGRRYLYQDDGIRDDFRLLPGVKHSVTFAASRVTVRDEAGAIIANLAAPWTAAMLEDLVWTSSDNLIFVTGPDPMRPQVIEIDKQTMGWSIRDYDFRVGIDSLIRAPFYRFADYGVTMRPSGIVGNISVYFSAPVLSSEHVGSIFRYAGKQVRITSVISPTEGTAYCVETLNRTISIPLDVFDEGSFLVGQIVKTSITGIEGEIISVNPVLKDITIVILNRWRKLDSEDRVVGPSADAGVANDGNYPQPPGATTQWDEQLMSGRRGWPQSVTKDRQRLIFSNFPQLKQAIVWSAVSDPFDLQVNADATGAIFELIDADCQVFHVVGGYDEFAVTDIGVFYIPISSENPLTPGSVEFRRLYSGEVANVKPVEVTEGVLFVDESLTGIYAITATGQTARPYVATEISQFHRHLFNDVRSITSNYGTPKNAARQIFVVNGDGTVVVGQYSSDWEFVGWRLWSGAGLVKSVSARFGEVVFSTTYQTIGTPLHVAERIDTAMELDCSVIYGGSGTLPFPVGETVQVMADGFFLGDFIVGPVNTVAVETAEYSQIFVGKEFDWFLMPNLSDFEGGEAFGQRQRRRKVSKVNAKVRDCQEFKIGRKVLCTWRGGEDTSQPMPKRSGVFTYRETGRSFDPEFTISKTIPGRFKLLELTTEVTI
ncbi:hypothetical protein JQC79_10605 [Ochrobactrum anthropi]|uniref:hypothetical protein n=1 Tax=Brucella anthropi TaxID=529 RepID=UPI001950AD4C|nr:hypothetical protein [Brucella anthropi]MBM6396200.1 hypothetical protein [Brucella anthropi]